MNSAGDLIEERLTVVLKGDLQVESVSSTPGRPSEKTEATVPSQRQMSGYKLALAKVFKPNLNKATEAHATDDHAAPLRAALLEAVPPGIRDRIVSAAGRSPGLVALELVLAPELEKYPWELIGEPGALAPADLDVVVWRSVMAPPPPQYRQPTSSLLLTGSAAMLRASPYVPEELNWIANALRDYETLRVFRYPATPFDRLHQLLATHRPAVFHFASHATNVSFQFQREAGPTPYDLDINAGAVGLELSKSAVQVAVFNCCDSASDPGDGQRPVAHRIAEVGGVAAIGMAGLLAPYAGGLFGKCFHTGLARGDSVLRAFHHGVSTLRNRPLFAALWSVPVLYSRSSNVIPFPASDEARARVGFTHISAHLEALEVELQSLIDSDPHTPGQWAKQGATAIVRVGCAGQYVSALSPARAASSAQATRHQQRLRKACDDLHSLLAALEAALRRLSHPACRPADRHDALIRLRTHRAQQQRIMQELNWLFEDAR